MTTQPASAARGAKSSPADSRKLIWFNGQLLSHDQARVNVFDHGLLYGDGVFEGIRSYNGRILKLRTHLNRLANSAKAIHLAMEYSVDELDAAVRRTLAANGLTDGYTRLCVTRGIGLLGINPANCKQPSTIIIADSIQLYPPHQYEQGIAVIVARTLRTPADSLDPRIKSMNYLNNILAKIEANNVGASEAIMLNHSGYVTEATADNIFIVTRRSGSPVLTTPPLDAGILEGVTRGLVLELARKHNIAVSQTNLTKDDLYAADECFLTGTGAEIIPVTHIDSRAVGDAKPGPITRRLIDAYHQLVSSNAPED